MDEYPKTYVPKVMRVERPTLRQLGFSIGYPDPDGVIRGYFFGPVPDLDTCLEVVPDQCGAVIVRNNENYSDDKIYVWGEDTNTWYHMEEEKE